MTATASVASRLTDRTLSPIVRYRHWLLGVPLAIGLTFVTTRAPHAAALVPVYVLSALLVSWYLVWDRYSWDRPIGGSRAAQVALTMVGTLLIGALLLQDETFYVIYAPYMLRFFVGMPFAWGLAATGTMLIPLLIATPGVAGPPPTSRPLLFLVRLAVAAVIGIVVRTLVREIAERRRLAAELGRAERAAGQHEERQRIARDIHDTLAQGFAGIVVHLEAAELERRRDPALADRHLASATTVARTSLEEARRMMGAMLPEALDGRDLGDALRRVTTEWQERTGVACDTVVTGDARALDRDIEVAVLRVTQEALTNAWKHAHATRVTVTLSYLDDVVVLDVVDNGVGMEAASTPPAAAGRGLPGMRSRVELLGGTLTIESTSQGCTISAAIPAILSETATWRARQDMAV